MDKILKQNFLKKTSLQFLIHKIENILIEFSRTSVPQLNFDCSNNQQLKFKSKK